MAPANDTKVERVVGAKRQVLKARVRAGMVDPQVWLEGLGNLQSEDGFRNAAVAKTSILQGGQTQITGLSKGEHFLMLYPSLDAGESRGEVNDVARIKKTAR